MRWWARAGVAGLGLMWLFAAILVIATREPTRPVWLPLVWLALGVFLCWKFVLQPRLIVRSMIRNNPASVDVEITFGDAGIDLIAHGMGEHHRSWSELVMVEPTAKGIVFAFYDTPLHWLPNRVFAKPSDRENFVRYVSARLEHQPTSGGAA